MDRRTRRELIARHAHEFAACINCIAFGRPAINPAFEIIGRDLLAFSAGSSGTFAPLNDPGLLITIRQVVDVSSGGSPTRARHSTVAGYHYAVADLNNVQEVVAYHLSP